MSERQIDRREFLRVASLAGGAMFLSAVTPACSPGAQGPDLSWNEALEVMGQKITGEMARAGLRERVWYPLVDFQQLPLTYLQQMHLPQEGYFGQEVMDYGRKMVLFSFVWENDLHERSFLKVPQGLIHLVNPEEEANAKLPEVQFVLDLSRFVNVIPRKVRYGDYKNHHDFRLSEFKNITFYTPERYLSESGALTQVKIRGPKDQLNIISGTPKTT